MPDPRRIPSGNDAGSLMPGGMTGVTLPCVTMAEARAGEGRHAQAEYSYQETRLQAIPSIARVQSFLVPPMLFQSLPIFVYLNGLPAKVA